MRLLSKFNSFIIVKSYFVLIGDIPNKCELFNHIKIVLWSSVTSDFRCLNSVHSGIYSQLVCQDLCEHSPTCVGISYGWISGRSDEGQCRTCRDDTLLYSQTNNFYKRPGKS